MKEEIVTFDIAVLAKEKGFNYMKSNCFGDNMAYNLDDPTAIPACRANVVIGYVLAPTQSLLQRWLREVHSILVYVMPELPKGNEFEVVYRSLKTSDQRIVGWYDSWEEALEEGLRESLKLIK